MNGEAFSLLDVLAALAKADAEHAATCPYCQIDREAQLFAELVERTKARPDSLPMKRAA